jgi:hypothetical protein
MAIIHAQSPGEAKEYMRLAMIDCADSVIIDAIGSHRNAEDDQWVDEYEVRCGQNGVPRTFEFTIEPRPRDFDGGGSGTGRSRRRS